MRRCTPDRSKGQVTAGEKFGRIRFWVLLFTRMSEYFRYAVSASVA